MSSKWLEKQRLREEEEAQKRAELAANMTIAEIQETFTDMSQLSDDGRHYTVLDNENIWSVARKFNLPTEELMEHNGIDDPYEVKGGTILRLPIAKKVKPPTVRFEVFDAPKPFHLVETTTKYSFGNVKHWKDIKPTGKTYQKNTNVEIVAIAHVPVENATAAYLMDALALGDYKETGRVAYSIGFNHSHLEPGHFVQPVVEPPKIAEAKIAAQELAEKIAEKEDLNTWKDSYIALPQPTRYVNLKTYMVKEHDGRRPTRPIYENQEVTIAGTFVKDDVLFGRPSGSVQNGYWFGIPMDNLLSEEELYNTVIDLPTRVVMKGTLSVQERGVVALSKTLSQVTRAKTWVKKQKI